MPLTILFDLDDTLLTNSTEDFIPAFLKSFRDQLGHNSEDPNKILPMLMASTQKIIQNNDPTLTLKQVFDANFYPALDWEYEQLKPQIDDFYHHKYPKLKELTAPLKESRPTVRKMLDRGYQIAIATHPIYPYNAIDQRLDWAGLAEEKQSFSLVTSYEEMHFAKPNPAYYTEILSLMGWPETPIIMVGDNKEADIEPTQALGLAAYWVSETHDYTQHDSKNPLGIGDLDGLISWIDSFSEEELTPDFKSPTASLAIQRSTPAALDTILKNLSPDVWQFSPGSDEWSLTEICCHLRDVDREIYIPRIQEVIQSNRPFLEAVDADAWARTRNYKQQDGRQAFVDFVSARVELLGLIDSLSEESWGKEIRHTIFGPISLAEILRISARHDKLHIQQVFKLLSLASK